ncbi:BAG family molecular chaperone regulator 1-like [Phalaenopsis equestris]|uniref:BAG family molecular chaperone regulator 1-like n=1 Tax=Phalaenopsis equestris TaxID=78828 RepID=UPI0009E20E7C|nr:BAG family molecular chaperone regulator 1-like [Phalaenopsis equestris]
MIRMQTKSSPVVVFESTKDSKEMIMEDEPAKWEVRPCGMLVQKRSTEDGRAAVPVPAIRLRVKHGSNYHEVYINSQANFGELRKVLAERTGLHPQDQKIFFKDKERDSAAFLDMSGVKDRSKLVVVEDPAAKAKRVLEMRRAAKLEKAVKSISQISLEVDKFVSQVSALEGVVLKGGKVADNEFLRLTELLMNELLKLEGIVADGDAHLQRRIQVKRVQKYVETLDMLKLKNAVPKSSSLPPQKAQKKAPPSSPKPKSVIVTTKWETFDSLFSPLPSPSSLTTTTSVAPTPRLDWELF